MASLGPAPFAHAPSGALAPVLGPASPWPRQTGDLSSVRPADGRVTSGGRRLRRPHPRYPAWAGLCDRRLRHCRRLIDRRREASVDPPFRLWLLVGVGVRAAFGLDRLHLERRRLAPECRFQNLVHVVHENELDLLADLLGDVSPVLLVLVGQDHDLCAGQVRREDLALEPADRQNAAAESDLAGHRHVLVDGESVGMPPAGTWMWSVLRSKTSRLIPRSRAWARIQERPALADSRITSPSWPVRMKSSLPSMSVTSMAITSPPTPVTTRPVAAPG